MPPQDPAAAHEDRAAKTADIARAKVKRVCTLVSAGWDWNAALALVYTTCPAAGINLMRKTMERQYGGGRGVTVARIRSVKVTATVPAPAEGNADATTEVTKAPGQLPFGAPYLDDLLEQQVKDLNAGALAVQRAAIVAFNEGKPASEQLPPIEADAEGNASLRWTDIRLFGGAAFSKADFDASAEYFLNSLSVRNTTDLALFANQYRDAEEGERDERKRNEKKNDEALKDEDVRQKVRALEAGTGMWVPLWALANGWQLAWLFMIIKKGRLPVESRLEAENLKAFADRTEKPVPCQDKDTATSTLSLAAVPDAPATMAEVFANTRTLWMSILLVGHGFKTSDAVSKARGGGAPLVTPLAIFGFLDMLAVAMWTPGMTSGTLWTMRNAIMREMRDAVNEDGASFDFALRNARRGLWRKILDFRELKVYHFGAATVDDAEGSKPPRKSIVIDPKPAIIGTTSTNSGGDGVAGTDLKRASESWEAACARHKKNRDRLEEELKKKTEECKKLKDEIKELKNQPKKPGPPRARDGGRGRDGWHRDKRERSWSNDRRRGTKRRERSRS